MKKIYILLIPILTILFSGCAVKNQISTEITQHKSRKLWKDRYSLAFFKKCGLKNINYNSINCSNKNINDKLVKYVRFDLMENLTQINLSHNNLTDIPFYLAQNPNIKKVDLSFNNIKYPFYSLKNMESLKNINYSNNNMIFLTEKVVIDTNDNLKINIKNNHIVNLSSEFNNKIVY